MGKETKICGPCESIACGGFSLATQILSFCHNMINSQVTDSKLFIKKKLLIVSWANSQ